MPTDRARSGGQRRLSPWALALCSMLCALLVALPAGAARRKKRRAAKPPAKAAPAPAVPAAAKPAPPAPAIGGVAPGRPRLAVVGFKMQGGLDESYATIIEDIVGAEASLLTDMEIISASDLKAFLEAAQYQRLLGCKEKVCLREFGSLLATQRMITGSVSKLGERHIVNLRMFDLVNGRVLQRSSQETKADLDTLAAAVRRAVPELFGVVGRIRIRNQPPGGEVFLDGRRVGPTPVERVSVRRPGKHVVSISGQGITSWEKEVEVEPGAELRLRAGNLSLVRLEQDARSRRTWGWSTGGGALVAAAAAGVLYYLAWDNDQRLDRMDLRTSTQAEIDDVTARTRGLSVGAASAGVVGLSLGITSAILLLSNPHQDALASNDGSE